MVVIVPPLAHRRERDPEAVPTLVARPIALAADQMRERIDDERAVPKERRRNEESPDETPRSAQQKEDGRKRDGRKQKVPVQPSELRVAGKVPDHFPLRRLVLGRQNPSDVRPPQTALPRRVDVARLVRE